ncbi:hypothetical protein [Brucella haematophila]|uniref:Uncharacterized protein n=1 Tax=Brucella haematophila TaxID=419474 RepID=A0ABX1DM60_9HYPH|nr:hypothetical protein [Brucella haematophila]NKC04056.1 hypothetical protein [Brucella haematophila]TMV05837.1 hypothetical protein FGI60_00465 [Brucella haematophila]
MTSAASVSYFLTHEASRMTREAMLDLFNAEFPDYDGNEEFHRGLCAGVAILQQEAERRGENLDIRGALARLAKVSRYEIEREFAEDVAAYPMGISAAIH